MIVAGVCEPHPTEATNQPNLTSRGAEAQKSVRNGSHQAASSRVSFVAAHPHPHPPHVDDSGRCRVFVHKWATGWAAWCFACQEWLIENERTRTTPDLIASEHAPPRTPKGQLF